MSNMRNLHLFKYQLADGGYYLILAECTRKSIVIDLFDKFKKTVSDPAYLDSHKFLQFLRSKGISCRQINPFIIHSWL